MSNFIVLEAPLPYFNAGKVLALTDAADGPLLSMQDILMQVCHLHRRSQQLNT
jgi:hypothetical protein